METVSTSSNPQSDQSVVTMFVQVMLKKIEINVLLHYSTRVCIPGLPVHWGIRPPPLAGQIGCVSLNFVESAVSCCNGREVRNRSREICHIKCHGCDTINM